LAKGGAQSGYALTKV